MALAVDAADRLWVVLWQSRGGPDGPPATSRAGRETLVEVIDLARGVVIARRTFDELIGDFMEPGLAYGPGEGPLGEPYTMVWRLELGGR
jgi:hypothetical protein